MGLPRLISILSVVVATGSMVAAAPKKGSAKAPAKGSGSATPPATGSSTPAAAPAPDAAGGSAVQPIEDTPPSDMNGTDENPDAPKAVGTETKVEVTAPGPKRPAEYPIEETLRPITLLQNMSEVSISPHAQVGDGGAYPYAGGDALRARYGITNEIQLGFTYAYAGIYPDPASTSSSGYTYGAHGGKALGLDVTVQLQKWLGVRVGVPVYISSPVAISIAAGAPIKFHFGDGKYAIGGLDDLLNIKVKRFAPDFYQDYSNALAAYTLQNSNTIQSPGHIRVSAYGEMQAKPNVAWIIRAGVDVGLSSDSTNTAGGAMGFAGGTTTFLRGGVQWSPRRFVDVGGSVGFDDLGHVGSFAPAVFLALRI